MSTVRRANRQSAAREQRVRSRVQKRLGAQRESRPAQSEESPDPLAEVYQGKLDNAIVALNELIGGYPFIVIRKCKPPDGCSWRVERSPTQVTVASVNADGEIQVQISGDYKVGAEWRDPRDVAERLAQVILFGHVMQNISNFKPKS